MANSKLKCTGCKDRFPAEGMIKLPAGNFHTIDCSITYAISTQNKQRERRLAKVRRDQGKADKARRVKHGADKEAIKTLTQLKSEAQAPFNKYVRLRDYWKPCISCGKSRECVEAEQGWKVGGAWDAGHFKSRGAKKQLRFNLDNVHKQCKTCNGGGKFSHKAATVDAQYETNLIAKIGRDKVMALKNNNDIVRFSPDYCRRVKKIFNKKARVAKKRIEEKGL